MPPTSQSPMNISSTLTGSKTSSLSSDRLLFILSLIRIFLFFNLESSLHLPPINVVNNHRNSFVSSHN
jgi:hypothetical protein